MGCSVSSSTGVITAGTTEGIITVRAADSEASSCYAEAQIKVIKLQELTVSGADLFGGTNPKIYTTAQQSGANVIITAVLNPSAPLADLPANFVTWINGTAGANQLQRLVSKATANTDVTVTATCGTSKSTRIYVRRVDASNPTIIPTEDPDVTQPATTNSCLPKTLVLDEWHITSVGDTWYARVDKITCPGEIKIKNWPNLPNTITVPNTANPVDGGNITNTLGLNKWDIAKWDLGNCNNTTGGGAGPWWHNTAANVAHEMYHWNTDWMETCIGIADWSDAESDIESIGVSVFSILTEAEAKNYLTNSVNNRFITFNNAAFTHYNNVIVPADVPGGGGGGYAAGQVVLDGDIAAIEAYRLNKGWQ